MTAQQENRLIQSTLQRRGIAISYEAANTLRRAQLTLHRWAELECNGVIQRDEETNKPRIWVYVGPRDLVGSVNGYLSAPTPDREKGALARVSRVCAQLGIHYYHQTDPRGCSLYVATVPIGAENYSTYGVAVIA